jgi:hypothetical protein
VKPDSVDYLFQNKYKPVLNIGKDISTKLIGIIMSPYCIVNNFMTCAVYEPYS